MEVMVGPTFSIDVSSTKPAYMRDRSSGGGDKGGGGGGGSCLFLKEEESGENENGSGFGVEDSSDSSSLIGATGDSEEEEEEEEENDDVSSKVQNRLNGTLASLASLEDSLPIKRGLSNHYSGKSKSFANLLDVSSVKDLEKVESPFNKRRRILMANKWSRRSSFYSWQNPKSMPLLALKENDQDQDQVQVQHDNNNHPSTSSSEDKQEVEERALPNLHHRKLKATAFKSQSCFSLADLQEEQHH